MDVTIGNLGVQRVTPWDVLRDPMRYQMLPQRTIPPNPTTAITKYDNTIVEMDDVRSWEVWENFPTATEIESFVRSSPTLNRLFCEIAIEDFERTSNGPYDFEFPAGRDFFKQLSGLLRHACLGSPGYQSGTGLITESKWVTIGSGKWPANEHRPHPKVPDLTAFWTYGDCFTLKDTKSNPHLDQAVPCLIVGDMMLSSKFQHEMLRPGTGGTFPKGAQYLVNKIHDYMDIHNDRYGYIITETELTMFRRRECMKWGQLDYSPAIPISAERGKLNAMMVLWYFHIKYAVMEEDGGWRLKSYYDICPPHLLGSSVKYQGQLDRK
jgi:hypothetical protein